MTGIPGHTNKTKYKSEYDELAYTIYSTQMFATKSHIAHACGVSDRTIDAWRHDFPSFDQRLQEGRSANKVLLWNYASGKICDKDFNTKLFTLQLQCKSGLKPDYPEDKEEAEAPKYSMDELRQMKEITEMTAKFDVEKT